MSEVNIPEGWAPVKLGSIVRVSSGIGFPKKYQGKSTGIYPVYKVGDISKSVFTQNGDLTHSNHHVDVKQANELKGEVFSEGATLFAKIGEAVKLNRRAFVLKPGLADNNVMAVLPHKAESNRFIYHFMRTVDLTDISRSTTVPSIRKGDIEELVINLPPIAEQTVISKKLDTLLAQVETTKVRLECIPKILKTFRQSVLAAAMNGKLTENWREINKLDVDSWSDGVLGDFVEKPTYGSSSKSQAIGDVPVLRMGNLQDGKLDWTNLVYTSDPAEIEKYKLSYGDVLFNRTNSPELVGKTSIYHGERKAIYAGYLIRIVCKENLNPEYLNYLLNSPDAREYCYQVKSDGVSQSNINAQKLKAYPISVPTIKEQIEIVRRVEELFAFADSSEQKANTALERVNNLTQSILAKAFSGDLTADWRGTNPELISGENSAGALLEKIKAERETLSNKKRPAKRTPARKKA